jgi:hypothetical protein
VDVSVGLTGINLNLDTLATVAAGGVAFATPDPPGSAVHTGHRFTMLDEPPGNWRDWSPRIAVGSPLLRTGVELPCLQRASLSWKTRRLGIRRTRRRAGWLLPLDDGRWVVPAQMVSPPSSATGDGAVLEVAGVRIPIADEETSVGAARAVVRPLPETDETELSRWSISQVRSVNAPEDVVLFTGPQEPQMIVTRSRMEASDGDWLVDTGIPLDDEWNGAAAVARQDAQLIGIVTIENGRAWIVRLGPLLGATPVDSVSSSERAAYSNP